MAGNGQDRDGNAEASDKHGGTERQVVEERVAVQPGKGAAVVVGGRGVSVKDFAQAVRAAVSQSRESGCRSAGPCRAEKNEKVRNENSNDSPGGLPGLDFLSKIFR